jgi:NAD(P)-dependent dehydrogenase (short-subunit alcohol dehydrogenase family)
MSPGNTTTNSGKDLVKLYTTYIKDKVILTTGVSPGGLGAYFVAAVAEAKPQLLILAGRNTAKGQQTADALTAQHPDVKVRILELDLGSLAAVRKAAATVNGWTDVEHIDVVVNNAGIMAVDWAKTPEGFESHFGTNHLGHFLFTNLIIGKLLASQAPRVVNVSSNGHRLSPIRFADFNFRVSIPFSCLCH